ncbi:MAG: carboxypeptidase-like regulatory domain-containing protein [Bacteroidetes bacterium]|nr:carboxypeptidase-like regulatory domain-containing protein [Bacteroidota bacterium]MBK8658504.1 carboxypeptidase-like regulatory domain-containing protein [Bacteroidota bacterium]
MIRFRVSSLLLFFLLLFGGVQQGYAQLNYDYLEGKFLIKGTVIDVQSKKPVPLTNIKILNSGKAVTTDSEGQFSFYVYKTDTLKFSSVGYLNKTLHISDLDPANYYTMEIQLIHDFVKLKEVTIYPFRNKEEFIEAFMDAKEVGKLEIYGIEKPKYSNKVPKAKFNNPISLLYEKVKKRRAANPDFRP